MPRGACTSRRGRSTSHLHLIANSHESQDRCRCAKATKQTSLRSPGRLSSVCAAFTVATNRSKLQYPRPSMHVMVKNRRVDQPPRPSRRRQAPPARASARGTRTAPARGASTAWRPAGSTRTDVGTASPPRSRRSRWSRRSESWNGGALRWWRGSNIAARHR